MGVEANFSTGDNLSPVGTWKRALHPDHPRSSYAPLLAALCFLSAIILCMSTREREDYHLSRYACYLIVLAGDESKLVVALGKAYLKPKKKKYRSHVSPACFYFGLPFPISASLVRSAL
jgi:hypothetical protein